MGVEQAAQAKCVALGTHLPNRVLGIGTEGVLHPAVAHIHCVLNRLGAGVHNGTGAEAVLLKSVDTKCTQARLTGVECDPYRRCFLLERRIAGLCQRRDSYDQPESQPERPTHDYAVAYSLKSLRSPTRNSHCRSLSIFNGELFPAPMIDHRGVTGVPCDGQNHSFKFRRGFEG